MKKIRFLLIAIIGTQLWGGDACPLPFNDLFHESINYQIAHP